MRSLLLNCLLVPQLFAGPRYFTPRLTGIVDLPNQKAALLDFSLGGGGETPRSLVMHENERDGEIEVIRINPVTGTVELRLAWTNTPVTVSLQPQDDRTRTAGGGLEFVDAGIDPVLSLYARFNDRTLLRWPRLRASSFTLVASTTNEPQAAFVLEQALAGEGIATIPDGKEFLMIVPASEAVLVKPRPAEIKSSTGDGSKPELMPVGAINFSDADLHQAAQIYAELIGRKLDQAPQVPRPTGVINFRNQTPLSKAECIYALDTLFRWQGLKVIPIAQAGPVVRPVFGTGQMS